MNRNQIIEQVFDRANNQMIIYTIRLTLPDQLSFQVFDRIESRMIPRETTYVAQMLRDFV